MFFVNPSKKKLFSRKCYTYITDIREKIDLAIIAVPAKHVIKVAEDCARKQVKGVVVISAGFAEAGNKELQDKLVSVLDKIPLIGPNCLGIIRAGSLNASFGLSNPKKGGIGFISQSGGLIESISFKYGFSSLISIGNEAGLDISDCMRMLDKDRQTKVIALYIEGLKHGRKFIETAKQISKPIVVLKGGKTEATRKTVASHTGALAGKREIYSAAFKKAGIFEVGTLAELSGVCKALSWQPRNKGRLGIVTNSGAYGILLADWAVELGVDLKAVKDVLGDASKKDYSSAINSLIKKNDSLIVVQTVQSKQRLKENIEVIIQAKQKYSKKAIISFLIPGVHYNEGIKMLEKHKIPNYSDVKKAILAIKGLNW